MSDFSTIRRLLRLARPYWGHLGGMVALGLLATPLALLMPVPLKIAVDSVLGSDPLPAWLAPLVPAAIETSDGALLVMAAVLQVGVVVLVEMQGLGTYVYGTYVGEHLTLHLRTRLFAHTQRLSFLFHDARGTADSVYRIQYDAPSIQYVLIHGLLPLASSGLKVVGMLVITVWIDARLAAVALAVVPLLFLSFYSYRTRMRPRYDALKAVESRALHVVQEVLTSLRVVKAFGREDGERRRFRARSREGTQSRIRVAAAEGVFGVVVNATTAVGTALVLYLGIRTVQTGGITLGELLMVLAYLAQLYGPMQTISETSASLQSYLAGARRALSLLDEQPDVQEADRPVSLSRARGHVAFQHVTFGYESGRPVLNDVSFDVPPGTRVGIVGRTGAGKSTLVSLVTRFYDPDDGRIVLDGVDLRHYALADLRNQFAIVLQDSVLFSASIADNIAYARPGATRSEIVAAAQAAGVHAFIQALPEGYDTEVGERGFRLSGGERQRVALARAFLKDAPLLILDEPTSAVDVQTEAAILGAMERLMEGRTTFMIAHRLTTLRYCDVVFVLHPTGLTPMPYDEAQVEAALA